MVVTGMDKSIYTEIILELYKSPLNKGVMEKPDLLAGGGNPTCGDQATFYLKISRGIIKGVKFSGSGCAISVASESLLTEMVKGKKISEAKKITEKELFAQLGGIIQTRIKCALLGLIVLKKGIEEYEKNGGKKTAVNGIVV